MEKSAVERTIEDLKNETVVIRHIIKLLNKDDPNYVKRNVDFDMLFLALSTVSDTLKKPGNK